MTPKKPKPEAAFHPMVMSNAGTLEVIEKSHHTLSELFWRLEAAERGERQIPLSEGIGTSKSAARARSGKSSGNGARPHSRTSSHSAQR